jgi:cytochrome c-type biogenesis protein
MIEDIFSYLSTALSGNVSIAIFASLGWGVLSILLSPCHLSSIPLIIGFINSQGKITAKRTFALSLVFAVGILITIALIGLITASFGRLMGDIGVYGIYFVALIFLIIGLYLMDIIKLPWDGAELKTTSKKGFAAALILGLLFGIGLGPCTFAFMAPVLGVVFQVARSNLIYAIVLLLTFAIGHCSVIVLAGTLTKKVQEYLNWTENSKTVSYIKKICGVLVILGGIYMIYNSF